jgi:hypothetical protein
MNLFFCTSSKEASKNRGERSKVGRRSAAVRKYGEHRSVEIGPLATVFRGLIVNG